MNGGRIKIGMKVEAARGRGQRYLGGTRRRIKWFIIDNWQLKVRSRPPGPGDIEMAKPGNESSHVLRLDRWTMIV